jgi:hypothetical protein
MTVTIIAANRRTAGPPRKDLRARVLAKLAELYPKDLAKVFDSLVEIEDNNAIRGRLLALRAQLLK